MTIYGQLQNRKDMSITQKTVLDPVAEESVVDPDEVKSEVSGKTSKR